MEVRDCPVMVIVARDRKTTRLGVAQVRGHVAVVEYSMPGVSMRAAYGVLGSAVLELVTYLHSGC